MCASSRIVFCAEKQAVTVAMEALEMVGLTAKRGQLTGEIPHGTRRLVEVARALARVPQCVLLDEPAAGLSARELEALYEVIVTVASEGVAVLLVEHNVPFVADVATTVTALHRGRIIDSGAPSILSGNAAVAEAFLGTTEKLGSWRP